MNVTITPQAEKFIRRMIRFNGGSETSGFRLSVKPGGCSGLSSEFTVEAAPLEGDSVLDSNGAKIFLPAESRILLEGVTVDFADTPMATGLTFVDPKAQPCGCSSADTGASAPPQTASVSISSIQRRN